MKLVKNYLKFEFEIHNIREQYFYINHTSKYKIQKINKVCYKILILRMGFAGAQA